MFAKIDRMYLPQGDLSGPDGLVAEFSADGGLEKLGVYFAGRCVSDELTLNAGQPKACGRFHRDPGGTSDWQNYYEDGTMEQFDAWSDNSRPSPTEWVAWVKGWIERIVAASRQFNDAPRLCVLARVGDLEGVLSEIERGADVEARDADGSTPLMLAADRGAVEVVRALLRAGAGVDAKQMGWDAHEQKNVAITTALLRVVRAKQSREVAELLLASGADANAVDAEGMTPLMHAVAGGDAPMTRLLIDRGADVNKQVPGPGGWTRCALLFAYNDIECTRVLFEQGADPNAPNAFSHVVHRSNRGAFNAKSEPANLLEIIRLFLDAGAELKAKPDARTTLLHLAAGSENPAYAELLIERGADVSARDKKGRTALDEARAWKREKTAALLVARGCP